MLVLAFSPAQYYTLCLLPSKRTRKSVLLDLGCNPLGIDFRYDLRAMPVGEFS